MTVPGRAGLWAAGLAVAVAACTLPAQAATRAPTRVYGKAGAFYRRDAGTALGHSFRSLYLDRRFDVGVGGALLGPRLGNYSLSGGAGLLTQQGAGPARSTARGRADARVQLLPEAPVTFNGFASAGRSDVAASSFETARSDGLGGGVGARLLPGASSSLDYEKLRDYFAGRRDDSKNLRAHHSQSLTLGPHAFNAGYDFLDRRASSGFAGVAYRSKRHTGRADTRLALGSLGQLGAWFQLDRERSETLRGNLPDRELDLLATNGDLVTALGRRATLRHSWADQLVRDAIAGPARTLRAQIAEQRLDSRLPLRPTIDLHTLVRTQWSHVGRLEDLWVATALTELAPTRITRLAVIPRAGINYYSGGLDDGRHAGEALGLTLRLRGEGASLEVVGTRDRTKGTGLRGRLDGPSYDGFSPRQVGAQLIHTLRTGASWSAGPFASNADWEFQDVDNTSLDLRFTTHRVHGSVGWRASERLRFDIGGDYATSETGSLSFQNDYRSASGTLSMAARPVAALELRTRGTYGRVPAAARESFSTFDQVAVYRFSQLELSAHFLAEKRDPRAAALDLGRTERLLELRLTRSFLGAF